MTCQSPHGDKLNALLHNDKLPKSDLDAHKKGVKRYDIWCNSLKNIPAGEEGFIQAVNLLNEYRMF